MKAAAAARKGLGWIWGGANAGIWEVSVDSACHSCSTASNLEEVCPRPLSDFIPRVPSALPWPANFVSPFRIGFRCVPAAQFYFLFLTAPPTPPPQSFLKIVSALRFRFRVSYSFLRIIFNLILVYLFNLAYVSLGLCSKGGLSGRRIFCKYFNRYVV